MLDDAAIARYARQVVIPGIGASGQEKLLRSTVLVVGDARGCRTAALYLRAAGVKVVTTEDATFDLVAVVDAPSLDRPMRERLTGLARPVCWSIVDSSGIRSGVHPAVPLPCPGGRPAGRHVLQDAAGCEIASLACGVLLGLDVRGGSFLPA